MPTFFRKGKKDWYQCDSSGNPLKAPTKKEVPVEMGATATLTEKKVTKEPTAVKQKRKPKLPPARTEDD